MIKKCRHLEPSQPSELSYRVRVSSILMNGHASEKPPKNAPKSVDLGTIEAKNVTKITSGGVWRRALNIRDFPIHFWGQKCIQK